MKTKIQSGITAILLLLAVSCSKDSSNTPGNNSSSLNNRNASGSNISPSGSVSSSQASNAFASAMDDAQPDNLTIPGSWILYYDWGCDGDRGSTVITFNANGTWYSGQGYTGIWVKGRHMLMLHFDRYNTTYSGVIFSREIKGIESTFQYAGSLQGCFTMAPYTGALNQDQKQQGGSPDAAGVIK
jgi:hypothetical protein